MKAFTIRRGNRLSRVTAIIGARLVACACILALAGCAYYPYPYPVPVSGAVPANFDRSFAAAADAMRDQGLAVNVEDRGSGTVIGRGGPGTVTATVRQQADGSVRVQFDASGPSEPGLIDRVLRSYNARMGR